MFDYILIPAAILYLSVVGSLFLYGLNFYYLTYLSIKQKSFPPLGSQSSRKWPKVTVQLPIYNEMYVATRLIDAAAALDYPRQKLEIQVLDDSTDETFHIAANVVRHWKNKGLNIVHLHRTNRDGFKAGALREGLKCALGEFTAIFDADFIPPQDFLKKTIPYFDSLDVAFVQTRWEHVNKAYSTLTLLQSLSLDAHFIVEQYSRSQAGYWFNFNGTAGVWRKAAIEDAGGWMARTLTEDLDLSYRAFLKGWRAVYLPNVRVPAELPVTFSAYRQQQQRWAQGSLACAALLLPKIWRKHIPLRVKIQSTFHLTGYLVHLLLFAYCILYPLLIVVSLNYAGLISIFGIALFFNVTSLAPTALFLVAQYRLGSRWWKIFPMVLLFSAFGGGMMLNTVRAVIQLLRHEKKVFERTPKLGIVRKGETFSNKNYQLKLDRLVYAEALFGVMNLFTAALALQFHHWLIAVYAALFGFGLLFVSGTSIIQHVRIYVDRRRVSSLSKT